MNGARSRGRDVLITPCPMCGWRRKGFLGATGGAPMAFLGPKPAAGCFSKTKQERAWFWKTNQDPPGSSWGVSRGLVKGHGPPGQFFDDQTGALLVLEKLPRALGGPSGSLLERLGGLSGCLGAVFGSLWALLRRQGHCGPSPDRLGGPLGHLGATSCPEMASQA